MTHLLRSEWIKFRSVRSTLVVLALAGALVVLIALIAANQANEDADKGPSGYSCVDDASAAAGSGSSQSNGFCPEGQTPELNTTPDVGHLTDLTVGVSIAALLFGVLGIQVIGQEYRFNTIRPTFTAVPQRFKVLVAKLVVVTVACAVVAATMVAFCWAVGTLMVDGFTVDGVDRRAAFGIVVFSIGWTAMGMGVGAILRQPIAAIPLLLGEAFVVENILGGLIHSTVRWLPFSNGFQMTLRTDDGGGSSDLQSVLGGGIYFFVITVAVLGIGMYLVDKRDA